MFFRPATILFILISTISINAQQPALPPLDRYRSDEHITDEMAQYVLQTSPPSIRGIIQHLNAPNPTLQVALLHGPAGIGKKTRTKVIARETGRILFILKLRDLSKSSGHNFLPVVSGLIRQIKEQQEADAIVALDCCDIFAMQFHTPDRNIALEFLHGLATETHEPHTRHVLYMPLTTSAVGKNLILRQVPLPTFTLLDGNDLEKERLILNHYFGRYPNSCSQAEKALVLSRVQTDNPTQIKNYFDQAAYITQGRFNNPLITYADLDLLLPPPEPTRLQKAWRHFCRTAAWVRDDPEARWAVKVGAFAVGACCINKYCPNLCPKRADCKE